MDRFKSYNLSEKERKLQQENKNLLYLEKQTDKRALNSKKDYRGVR